MPSDVSWPAGRSKVDVVRYQVTPGAVPLAGSVTGFQPRSGKPGSDQPARSPYNPPVLSGPRTGSTRFSPSRAPCRRQVTDVSAPSIRAPRSPRADRLLLSYGEVSSCPMSTVSTESSLSPDFSDPGGKVKSCRPSPRAEPRNVPLSHTEMSPAWPPLWLVRPMPVSLPDAVKCPRYQVFPVWKP